MTDQRPVPLTTHITLPRGMSFAKRAQARDYAYIALKRYVATCGFTVRPITANVPLTQVNGLDTVITCTWPKQFGGRDSTAETWVRNALAILELPVPNVIDILPLKVRAVTEALPISVDHGVVMEPAWSGMDRSDALSWQDSAMILVIALTLTASLAFAVFSYLKDRK